MPFLPNVNLQSSMATHYHDHHGFDPQSVYDGDEFYDGDELYDGEEMYDGEEIYEGEDFPDEDFYYDEGDNEHCGVAYDDNDIQENNSSGDGYHEEGHVELNDDLGGDHVAPNAPQVSTSFFKHAQNFSVNGGRFSAVSGSYYSLGPLHGPGRENAHSGISMPTDPEALDGQRKSAPLSGTSTATPLQHPSRPPSYSPPRVQSHSRRKVPEPSFFEGAKGGDINGGTFTSVEGSCYYYGHEDGPRAPPSGYPAPARSRYNSHDNVDPRWRRPPKATNTSDGRKNLRSRRNFNPPASNLPHHDRRPISFYKNASNFCITSGNFMTVGGECYGLSEPPPRAPFRSQPQARYPQHPSQFQRPRISVEKDSPNTFRSGIRKSFPADQFASRPLLRTPRGPDASPRPPRAPSSADVPLPHIRSPIGPTSDAGPAQSAPRSQQNGSSTDRNLELSLPRGSETITTRTTDVRTFTAELGKLSLSYKRSKSSAHHSQTQMHS